MRLLRGRDVVRLMQACMAVAIAAEFSLAQTTRFDDGEPIILTRELPRSGLRINPGLLSLEMVSLYHHNRTDNHQDNGRVETTDFVLGQTLNYDTTGYYLHPNYLSLEMSFSGGAEERFSDTNGQDSTTVGPLYRWDVSATYLRTGEWPLTVFSRRDQNWIFRDFGAAIEAQTTETGLSLNHRIGKFDNTLSISHIESSQDGPEPEDDLRYTQDRISWSAFALLSQSQTLEMAYNYSRIDETNGVDFEYQQQDASATHRANFGERGGSRLTSSVRWSEYSGTSDVNRFRWSESLMLRHSRKFRTRYNYSFERLNLRDYTTDTHRASTGFSHSLYQSLTTDADIGIMRTDDSEGYQTTETFADIDWQYRKRVPMGRLGANLNLGWSRAESEGSGEIQVIDMVSSFTDPLPIVLPSNTSPSSIVLTDPSGLLYLPGVDYTVEDFGDRVELHRVIGGRIGSGQSVLIDYTQDSLPANVIETRRLGSGLRYDFDRGPLDGLGLFVRYSLQRQEIDSPDPGRVPFNEYDDYVYGADYRFLKEFTVGAEHQEHDSTVYPYNADRVYFRWIRNAAETTWSVNGTYTRIELIDDDNVLGLYTISARVDHRFSTRLSGSALVMWRDESNRRYGDNTGFEEQLELRWNYRQVDLYLQARAAQFRGDAQDTNFEFIRMGIRRYF